LAYAGGSRPPSLLGSNPRERTIRTLCYTSNMPSRNPELNRAAVKRHYEKNKKAYFERNVARKKRIALYVKNKKDVPCADCGVKYPTYVMHFDHTSDDKEINIAHAANAGWGIPRIDKEIAKCDVVCANCHAERTHKRKMPC